VIRGSSGDSFHAGLPTGMPEPAPGDPAKTRRAADSAGAAQNGITREMRERLSHLADQLIPESDEMPSASSVDIAYGQLDTVLHSRPDLGPHLRNALSGPEAENALRWIESLDREEREAVTVTIVAAYYMHPKVKALLGYPGQQAIGVSVGGFPEYVSEGLLDSVVERGPIYRSRLDE
jgi:hypothetical protein